LVGVSKIFFENFSTFYNFHLGAYAITNGAVTGASQVQGYECVSTGTQAMPPSWTNNTDPNVDFDTQGRAYQTTLPFNAFWEGGLHPNGAIDVSYSDDLGLHWTKGNGGRDLEPNNNETSLAFGHVEDKQWIAVNHIPGNRYRDHVYAMWTTFNGAAGNGKIRAAQFDVRLRQSTDGGLTWGPVQTVNDAPNSATTDQFQPSVAAGPGGAVAVAFYDRRATCPGDASILPAHRGAANTCIDVSLQAYKDRGGVAGAAPVGGNVRVSTFTWDPDQPQQHVGGLTQYPCAGHTDPCPHGRGFIGDYFGLAISSANIYTFGVSTHYHRAPSPLTTAALSTTRTRSWGSCPEPRSAPTTERVPPRAAPDATRPGPAVRRAAAPPRRFGANRPSGASALLTPDSLPLAPCDSGTHTRLTWGVLARSASRRPSPARRSALVV
jgi:hypothetical protein